MKKSIKKLSSVVSMAAIMSTTFGANIVSAKTTTLSPYNGNSLIESAAAGTAAESDGVYATNPSSGVGKKATISIDGSFSDWTEDMLIAQGAAGDMATRFKGCHENWVMDSYALYGAWDDDNVYIGWQGVNIFDTFWGQDGNGPLSDNGKPGDAPIFIAIDTGKGNPMNGKVMDKGAEANLWGMDIGFTTRVDAIIGVKSNLSGVPSIFKADSTGTCDYTKTDLCQTLKEAGIEVDKVDDCFPSKIMGVWNPGDDNELASYDSESNWIDYKTATEDMTRPHDTKYDTFFEMKIPYSALGITKEDLEQNGLGVMQIIGRGESGMDCVPHDPSMLDNVQGDYGPDPSSTHEKDDHDDITVPLASIGKLRDPSVVVDPPVAKDPTIKSLKADKDDAVAGDEVKITCDADNAKSYSFTIDGEAVDDSEVSNGVLTHTFDKEGTYKVAVTVKGASGTKDATDDIDVKVAKKGDKPPVEDTLSISKFTATPEGTCEEGSKVKLEAAATGSDDCEYKFTVVDADDEESLISDYSEKTTATWTAKTAGDYTLKVYAKEADADEDKAVSKEIENFKVTTKPEETEELTMDSFTADKEEGTIEPETEVKFTAEASGSDDITYKYTISKDGEDEEDLESEDGEATWKPTEEGTYEIKVTASKEGYKDATESKTYEVKKSEEPSEEKEFKAILSSTAKEEQKLGDKVKFTADSQNAKGDVTYKFVVNDEDSKYSNEDFSPKASYTFNPEEKGTYEVYVIAKDSETGEEKKSDAIKVTFAEDNDEENELITSIVVSPKSCKVGDTVTITPDTENETGKVTYQLLIDGKEEGKAAVLDKLSWIPAKAGTYKVSVKATDEDGKTDTSQEVTVIVGEKDQQPDDGKDTPSGDNTPVKALGILGILGSAVAVLSRKRAK